MTQAGGTPLNKLRLFWQDLAQVRPRLLFANFLSTLTPASALGWLRPLFYRSIGLRIGPRTRIFGRIHFTGQGSVVANVRIGESCIITTPLYLNASAPITIGDRVGVGHHVIIITDTHDMEDPLNRCGPGHARPVTVEDGAWICARATILPGVTLGRGSVVAAGAVVTRDVPPDTLVGGNPARAIKRLPTAPRPGPQLPGDPRPPVSEPPAPHRAR